MWKHHFNELYNSVAIGDEMKTFSDRKMNNIAGTFSTFTINFTIYLVSLQRR